MKQETVWVVSSGQYSDYGINAICSTKERAEYTKKLIGADNDVFEMNVDECVGLVPEGFKAWDVTMDRHGNTIGPVRETNIYGRDSLRALPYGNNVRNSSGDVSNCYAFCVVAKDEEGAVKVANEKRVQIIAANAWFEGEGAWQKWQAFRNTLGSTIDVDGIL